MRQIVAASQPAAATAGIELLRSGVNAADAAVAVAAALAVTEPMSTGPGGDLFCLFFDARTKSVRAINASGKSPAAISIDMLRNAGITDSIPLRSPFAVTVPGAVAGWADILSRFGSGKVSLAEALAPAIRIAQDGFQLGNVASLMWHEEAQELSRMSPIGNEFIPPPAGPGSTVRLPNLASTLQSIADGGTDAIYNGPIASKIVHEIQSRGGCLAESDLASHSSLVTEPISIEYKHIRLHEHAPNGQGIVALIALGILRELQNEGTIHGISNYKHNSPEYIHLIIEALRIAFADGKYFVADPDLNPAPIADLLNPSYLSSRAKLFDPTRASDTIAHGTSASPCDTVYFSVIDKDGNACSVVNSLYSHFGSSIVVPGTGIALHSRGANFVLQEDHPNVLAPSKRPYHTIIPAIVTNKDTGDLIMSFGVMGGFMQPQGHLQVLLNILHFGMTPQEALDASRICIVPEKRTVYAEETLSEETIRGLRLLGHDIHVWNGLAGQPFGRGQIIQIDENGERIAGSDRRADGLAMTDD